MSPRWQDLRDRAETMLNAIKAEGRAATADETKTLRTLIEEATLEKQVAEFGEGIRSLGEDGGLGGGFYNTIKAAGFDRKTHPDVTFPFGAVASFDGDYGLDGVRRVVSSPPLGADSRFLFPNLRQETVEVDTTSVPSFRQKSRTLPSPLATMIRDIVATSNKPETDTETELVTGELKQIATVESGVPNIMLENAAFRDFIDFDLRFAYASAVDAHVVSQIAAAAPPTGTASSALSMLEPVVAAAEAVAAAGYSPSILVGAPEYLIDLMFTLQPGSGDYLFSGKQIDLGLRKVAVRGLGDPMVIDPAAAGVLFTSRVSHKAFEENAGKTNTSTVRIESNGLFVVQRLKAIALVEVES